MHDTNIIFDSITREGDQVTYAKGKVLIGNDKWSFDSENFSFNGDVYQSPTKFTKVQGETIIQREGEISLDSQLTVVSGFIEDYYESVHFTGGKEAASPFQLKNSFSQQETIQTNLTEQSVDSLSEPTEDPSYLPAEEDQSTTSTDPSVPDDEYVSLAETNIRSKISTSYVYAHLVGPSSLSRSANYSKYTARAWLKNRYDGVIYTPRYQYTYINPVDYSSGGGVSIQGTYPKGDSASPISIAVAYSSISAGMDFNSEPGAEANYTGQSYVRNYNIGYPQSDYWLNYDSGFGGTEGVGANFYTDMMGASSVGSSYKVNWSVKWKIWDRDNKIYFERSGSGYYYVKATS